MNSISETGRGLGRAGGGQVRNRYGSEFGTKPTATLPCYNQGLKISVRNVTRDAVLADAAHSADTSAQRRTGLLKHTHLEPGDGLWIVPCESVHSFFMKFTIDVLYLDRKHRVKKIRPEMAPWRVSACLTAHSVLELPAGTITRTGTQAGDQLEIKTLSSPAGGGVL